MESSRLFNLNHMLCQGVLSNSHCGLVELRTPDIAVLNELSIGDYIDHKQKQSGGYHLRSGMRATSVELDDLKLHRRKAKRLLLAGESDENCVMRLLASPTRVQRHHR